MPRSLRAFVFCSSVLLACGLPAAAHEPGLSQVRVQDTPAGLQVSLRFDSEDWERLAPAHSADAGVQLRADGRTLAPLASATVHRDGDHVDVAIRYPAAGERSLRFAFTGFAALRLGHRQYVERRDGAGTRIADAVLKESAPEALLAREPR